jgi:hypothetical protein
MEASAHLLVDDIAPRALAQARVSAARRGGARAPAGLDAAPRAARTRRRRPRLDARHGTRAMGAREIAVHAQSLVAAKGELFAAHGA